MPKYKKTYDEMLDRYEEEFSTFKLVHDKYGANPNRNREEFNKVGLPILDIIREYEDMLCNYSESGKFGKYSAILSEKFWDLIRKNFPHIDEVGVE